MICCTNGFRRIYASWNDLKGAFGLIRFTGIVMKRRWGPSDDLLRCTSSQFWGLPRLLFESDTTWYDIFILWCRDRRRMGGAAGFLGDCSDPRLKASGDMSLLCVFPRLTFLDIVLPLKLPNSFCRCRSFNPSSTSLGVDGDELLSSSSAMMLKERAM